MTDDTEIVRTSLRLPKAMYDRINFSANERGLTMHADILRRLQETLELDEYVPKVNAHEDKTELVINSLSHRERALVSAIVEAIRSPNKD